MKRSRFGLAAFVRPALAFFISAGLPGAAGAQAGIELLDEPAPTAPEPAPAAPATKPAGGPATAEEAAAAGQRPKSWTVKCSPPAADKPASCQMSQILANAKTKQRVLAVSIRKQPKGPMSMVLALPHGLFLPGAVSIQVDAGQKKSIPIQASDAKGVYAAVPMDEALIASMKRGATFKVGVVGMNRRPVNIPVTLAGFTAAADQLAATN